MPSQKLSQLAISGEKVQDVAKSVGKGVRAVRGFLNLNSRVLVS